MFPAISVTYVCSPVQSWIVVDLLWSEFSWTLGVSVLSFSDSQILKSENKELFLLWGLQALGRSILLSRVTVCDLQGLASSSALAVQRVLRSVLPAPCALGGKIGFCSPAAFLRVWIQWVSPVKCSEVLGRNGTERLTAIIKAINTGNILSYIFLIFSSLSSTLVLLIWFCHFAFLSPPLCNIYDIM